MLAVTPAFQYAPAFYAAESESTEELTDAVKQEVVRRIRRSKRQMMIIYIMIFQT